MVLNRKQRKEEFSSVIRNVFESQEDDSLSKSLKENGINEVSSLICLTEEDIATMVFTDDKGDTQDLDDVDKILLRSFTSF